MKTKLTLSVLLVALAGGQYVMAQTMIPDESAKNWNRWSNLERASQILGKKIKVSQDENQAKVKDLTIDLRNGRIVEVIVGLGGVMGMDEQFVAVPPSQFIWDASAKTLELKADLARLKAAPSFDLTHWQANVLPANVVKVYQHFDAQPYFADGVQLADRANNGYGEVRRGSEIIGAAVRNPQNEKLGKVDNLMVDLPAGRVVEVILAAGGFLGLGDELSPIPPQSLRAGTEKETLQLDTTKEALANAPHFKSSQWSDVNHPENVGTVYRSYKVDLYAADNTAQNRRDRGPEALTPFQQGTSPGDLETTRQIRQAILATAGLSVDARNVKVITLNGQVTLRGPVKSEAEKRQIGDIAAKVAASGQVNNQIQVEGNPTTSVAQ